MTISTDHMNNISELKNFIIKRFIIAIAIISIGEYLMITLINATIVKFISYAFFDGMDITSLKMSGAIFALVAYLGAVIIELLSYLIPSQMRLTMDGARRYIEQNLQALILNLPNSGKYVSLNASS